MFRRIFFHAVTAGFLASLAGFIYSRIYYFATEIDFSKVANLTTVSSYCILFCMLAAALNYACIRFFFSAENHFQFYIFHRFIQMVMIPISLSLPLDIKSPNCLGPGVPIIFFPAIAPYRQPDFQLED
jgi:hypothetical protein